MEYQIGNVFTWWDEDILYYYRLEKKVSGKDLYECVDLCSGSGSIYLTDEELTENATFIKSSY